MYEKCRHKQKNRKTHYFRLIFRRFRKNGFFSERPRVLDVKAVFQDLDGVCQGVNVLSPDIFGQKLPCTAVCERRATASKTPLANSAERAMLL